MNLSEIKKEYMDKFGETGRTEPLYYGGDTEALKESGFFIADTAEEIWNFFLPYLPKEDTALDPNFTFRGKPILVDTKEIKSQAIQEFVEWKKTLGHEYDGISDVGLADEYIKQENK